VTNGRAFLSEGAFVWSNFPFGPPDHPGRPGPAPHVAYCLGVRRHGGAERALLAYTSSGPWRPVGETVPLGVINFDTPSAAQLNQRQFHLDLRCLARVPLTPPWFPLMASSSRGILAWADGPLKDRIAGVAAELVRRGVRHIVIRGVLD